MRQHHHLGGIGAEVSMYVLRAGPFQPRQDAAGFGEINEMEREQPVGADAHAQRRPQCGGES
jgi:hypothetical protein